MGIIELFLTYFKIGLFTVGGGLAAIPLMQKEIVETGVLDIQSFANMIAISQSTPGPIGINMATYIGYREVGIAGSLAATIGMVFPSLIIITIIAHILDRFKDNEYVKAAMSGIRPAVIGIIGVALIAIAKVSILTGKENIWGMKFDIKALLLLLVFIPIVMKTKFHPTLLVLLAGVCGIIVF